MKYREVRKLRGKRGNEVKIRRYRNRRNKI